MQSIFLLATERYYFFCNNMPNRLLHLHDIKNIKQPEQVAALFQKLGYKAICQLIDVRDLELSDGSTEAINQAYLIASQGDKELQVFLFQLHPKEWNLLRNVTEKMLAIAKNLCQRGSNFFLLGTKDYKQLMALQYLLCLTIAEMPV